MPTFRRTLKLMGYGLPLLIGLPVVAFAADVLWPRKEAQPPRSNQPFAFSGVTIVDVKSGALLADQTVVVRANRIECDRFDVVLSIGPIEDDGTRAEVRFSA